MEPMTIAMLVGAGLGALKSNEEKGIWSDQQKAEAEKSRYAPWTGQWGQNLPGPTGDMGNIMAGTMAGAAIGQQMKPSAPSNDNANLKLDNVDMDGIDNTMPQGNFYEIQRLKRRGMFDDYDSGSGSLYA
jgi:hypothetical protein